MLPFPEARARIFAAARSLDGEDVPVEDAVGRVLAGDVFAASPLPRWDHSAMDGIAYAFVAGQTRFRLAGESRAGGEAGALPPGTAARISTGARLPAGADTVAPRELVRWEGDEAVLASELPRGKHVRRAGEDLPRGAIALTAGTRIGAGALAVLATLDLPRVRVTRRPRVTLLSTGDELRAPGTTGGVASIPDASGAMLAAIARGFGADVSRAHCRDDQGATNDALARALEGVDLVMTAGGASKGEHDHVRGAVAALGGEMVMDDVAIKPGKPIAVARIDETFVAIIPGNPGAAFVTFHAFVAPLIRGLLGEREAPAITARLGSRAEGARGRTELLRVRLELRDDGVWCAVQPNQAPGAIVGLELCDGLAEIAAPTAAGERVPVYLV